MNRSPIAAAVERHRLVDVAQRTGIGIHATTRTVTVRCPMPAHGHAERTPSMRLYLDADRYYCFGCGAKGDIVQWVRDAEALSLAEAIKVLDSGRPIVNAWAGNPRTSRNTLRSVGPPSSPGNGEAISRAEPPDLGRTPAARVFAALDAAWGYYTYGPLHARGTAYLAERSIQIGLLESHTGRAEVGHTPARPDGLVNALRSRGFSDDELFDAGLAYRRFGTDRLCDFYRHRVLIPIRGSRQRVCGFVGRNVGDARWPKYKNPPTTLAYDKSVNLFQPLPPPRHPHGRVVVVEGTLDALAIACAAVCAGQARCLCPITQSGRELSLHQLDVALRLHTGPLVISFDGDAAGRDSNQRLLRTVLRRGRSAVLIAFPEGVDPASWLAENGPRGLDAWLHSGGQGRSDSTSSVYSVSYGGSGSRSHIDSNYQAVASSEVDL